jgi:hypothetical protein
VVHIAILFAYYHLLQSPDEPRTNIVDIRKYFFLLLLLLLACTYSIQL